MSFLTLSFNFLITIITIGWLVVLLHWTTCGGCFSCFCQVVPARGMANVNFSFTPFPTEEVVRDMDCNGYALGYMSLDKVMLSPLKLLTFVSDYQETLNL